MHSVLEAAALLLLLDGTLQAESIAWPYTGQHLRFCLQCGKLEPLSCFDGSKR